MRAELNPFSQGYTTNQSLPPFFSTPICTLQINRAIVTSFCLAIGIIALNKENKQKARAYTHIFPFFLPPPGGVTVAPPTHLKRPVMSHIFTHGDCSPIARKTCPSQLILNPSTEDSAFSTVESILGILHGISGVLIHI